ISVPDDETVTRGAADPRPNGRSVDLGRDAYGDGIAVRATREHHRAGPDRVRDVTRRRRSPPRDRRVWSGDGACFVDHRPIEGEPVRRQRRQLIYIALVAVALAVGLLVVGNKSTAHRQADGRPNI